MHIRLHLLANGVVLICYCDMLQDLACKATPKFQRGYFRKNRNIFGILRYIKLKCNSYLYMRLHELESDVELSNT
jgi:hypothetical protein